MTTSRPVACKPGRDDVMCERGREPRFANRLRMTLNALALQDRCDFVVRHERLGRRRSRMAAIDDTRSSRVAAFEPTSLDDATAVADSQLERLVQDPSSSCVEVYLAKRLNSTSALPLEIARRCASESSKRSSSSAK